MNKSQNIIIIILFIILTISVIITCVLIIIVMLTIISDKLTQLYAGPTRNEELRSTSQVQVLCQKYIKIWMNLNIWTLYTYIFKLNYPAPCWLLKATTFKIPTVIHPSVLCQPNPLLPCDRNWRRLSLKIHPRQQQVPNHHHHCLTLSFY